MQADDSLIKDLEKAFKELMKELKGDQPLDMKVKVFNAGVALAKVKHAITEKDEGSEFNPDMDA